MSTPKKSIQQEPRIISDSRKCKKHNMWMRKGECSVCYVENKAKIKAEELITGFNKPKVKITKL